MEKDIMDTLRLSSPGRDVSTCSSVISPIIGTKMNPLYVTGGGGGGSWPNRSHISVGGSGGGGGGGGDGDTIVSNNNTLNLNHYLSSTLRRRSRNYSVPNVEQLLVSDLNPGRILNQNLRLLQLFLLSQIEDITETDRRDDKKQNGFDDSSALYRFNRDCFLVQNTTEPSCHVLHLLCQCYDYKECEKLFRDVWPIADKKMDAAFRRTVSGFIKGIIANHPQFFAEIKLETISFLLVNPWGDRFIQLIECLAELVINRIVRGNLSPEASGKICNKPNFYGNNNSAVTSRQILVLMEQTRLLMNNTAQMRRKTLKEGIHARKIAERVRSHIDSIELEIDNKSQKIEEIRQAVPELNFDENFNGLAAPSYSFERIKMLANWSLESAVNTNMQGVDRVLTSQLETVSNVAHSLETLFNKYKSVWYVIGLNEPKPRVLDIENLYIVTSKIATFAGFIKTIKLITRKFLDDERLKQAIPTELLQKFKNLHLKFDHLKLCSKKLESQRADISRRYLDCDLHLLMDQKTNFQGVDWNILSKLNVPPLNCGLLYTPSKKRKLPTKSGYTPRLMNFLEPQEMKGLQDSSVDGLHITDRTPRLEKIMRHTNQPLVDSNTTMSKLQSNQENVGKPMADKVDALTVPHLNTALTPVMSSVTSSVANSHKPPLPNIRVSLTGVTSCRKRSESSTVVKSNGFALEENNGSDVSMSSDSATPVRISASAQTRIAKIMSALSTPVSSANCSFVSLRVSDSFDIKPGSSSRRSSLAFRSRISTSSIDGGSLIPDAHNKSLLENWTDEKGIMDMSMNSNGLWGAVGSSEDES